MTAATTTSMKYRLRFSKTGTLRLVSHHDLVRCLERMLRCAALPMAYSQGFNPRPKVMFTLALALGTEGHREVVELELVEPLDPQAVRNRLQEQAPEGLCFLEVLPIARGRPVPASTVCYALRVPEPRRDVARLALARFLEQTQWPITRTNRQGKTRHLDLRDQVLRAHCDAEGWLRFVLRVDSVCSARPDELLQAWDLADILEQGAVLARTDIRLIDEDDPILPLGIGPNEGGDAVRSAAQITPGPLGSPRSSPGSGAVTTNPVCPTEPV